MIKILPCGHKVDTPALVVFEGGRRECAACYQESRMSAMTRVNVSSIPLPINTHSSAIAFCPRVDLCCCWITGVLCEECAAGRRSACLCAKEQLVERPFQASDFMIVQGGLRWLVVDVLAYYREHVEKVFFKGKTRKECVAWIDRTLRSAR